MEEIRKCEHCGSMVEAADGECINGEFWCQHCLDTQTIICEHCGARVLRRKSVEERICQNCYDKHYQRCDSCGGLIRYDDANGSDPNDSE